MRGLGRPYLGLAEEFPGLGGGNRIELRPVNADMWDWEFLASLVLGTVVLCCSFAILALPVQFILAEIGLILPFWLCMLLVGVVSGTMLISVLRWAAINDDVPSSQ
jgi:hypothetical protein